MRVLLISTNTLEIPYPVYPLGLDHVAHALSKAHEVQIADINALGGVEPLINIIHDFAPDVVGLSLRNIDNTDQRDQESFVADYRQLARLIRGNTKALLVLGGSGFTLFPQELINMLHADYGIVGEGERMADLLTAIKHQSPVHKIPGVLTPKGRPEIPLPIKAPFGRDHLPEDQHLKYYLNKGGMLNLQTKRGCPYRCIYCTYPGIEGRTLRFIPPKKVAEEALRLQAAGAKYFFITDSVFNSHMDHSMSVAEAFIAAGLEIPWGAFFAPMAPPKGYFELMARAGLTHAEFGTESMCDGILRTYKKPFRTKDVFESHEAAIESGLNASHFFLLGGPGENSASIDETFDNIERLKQSVFFFFALCASILVRIFMIWLCWKVRFRPGPRYSNPASTLPKGSPRRTSLRDLKNGPRTATIGL